MGLTLYYAPGACSLAPHVALEEAGAAFEGVRLSLADGDQRKPDYLALNPKGRVPTLLVDGRALTEVTAILAYLDRRFPTVGLLPGHDPLLAGRAFELISYFASTLHVAFAQTSRPERYADDPEVKAALAEPGRLRFIHGLDLVEAAAASPDAWLVGETFTAVDAYALVIRRWAERLGVDLARYPAWTRKGDRALQRPSVLRALERESTPLSAAA